MTPVEFIKHTFSFLTRHNTLVVLGVVVLNTINILVNHANTRVIPITLILLMMYMIMYRSEWRNKWILLFVYASFSVLTLGGESVVIWMTQGHALRYGKPSAGGNVPVWLFSAYLNMVLTVYLLTEYGNWMYDKWTKPTTFET